MRFAWLLACCTVVMAKVASNVLEIDLAFPRNDTYAPTESFPIVFAFQNPEWAYDLNPRIHYTIRNWDDMFGPDRVDVVWSYDLKSINWSSHNPYFAYNFLTDFNREGQWWLTWSITWTNCDTSPHYYSQGPELMHNKSIWSILFTTQKSAPKVDLIAATSNKTCPEELGVAIGLSNNTLRIPEHVKWSGGDRCRVLASSTPTPTPDPCQVKIDSAIAASMSASWKTRLCKGFNPPSDCPEDDKSAPQQLVIIGVSCLLAAIGAFGFLLM